jgi:hypothetical protein
MIKLLSAFGIETLREYEKWRVNYSTVKVKSNCSEIEKDIRIMIAGDAVKAVPSRQRVEYPRTNYDDVNLPR